MAHHAKATMPPSSPELSRKAAIVGIGETDFAKDYQAARKREPGYQLPTPELLATTAFERALEDSGLKRQDIDGVLVSFIYGGPSAAETAALLGLAPPRFTVDYGGIMAGPLPAVCAAIAAGECDTVAMVYAVASRAIGRTFGGRTHQADQTGTPSSYYYYHPWGFSSQAAHWAFIWRHYQQTYGVTEADLGTVAVELRRHAMANPNAIMQTPLSIEDYLASRYVVRPLHLFDLCLVNDGAVCLIVRRADRAHDLRHAPVLVSGWASAHVKRDKMHALVRERLAPQMRASAAEMFAMAGRSLADVQHFEAYDASSIHLVNQVEGYGLAAPGAGLDLFKNANGKLPINTSGGMLSEAYMQGWNHVVEITRQLRHEAGPRQVPDANVSLFSLAQTDRAHPILFERGA